MYVQGAKVKVFKYNDGLWPNTAAISWAFGAYVGGIALCLLPTGMLSVLGVLMLSHAMIIAAYLVHECAHNTIFVSARHNRLLAESLNWITGALYSPFEAIRHKHMRHHVDRADVVAYDYRRWVSTASPAVARWLKRSEAIGFPALEVAMRLLAIAVPFIDPAFAKYRQRVISVLVARSVFFILLASVSPKFLVLYFVAYLFCLQVLRFMDAYQHTFTLRDDLYGELTIKGPEPGLDRDYEERNTFSNPISERFPWLNLLILNFGYHNVHHRRPTQPWHRLPAQHREFYANSEQVLMPRETRASFLRYRRERLLNEDDPDIGVKRGNAENFIGVDGVSFLIPF